VNTAATAKVADAGHRDALADNQPDDVGVSKPNVEA